MEANFITPPSGPEGSKRERSSEHILRRVRGRHSLANLRKKTEASASVSATPGRQSRFMEDASVGGATLPVHSSTPGANDDARGLTRVGQKLASMNPMNVIRSFVKTYEQTKDDLTVYNIEQNRLKAAQTPSKEDSSPEKPQNPFRTLRRASYSTLKRVRSEVSLSAYGQSTTSLNSKRMSDDPHILRPSASKKDLKHQQKLCRKVSDLEHQLEKARRELDQAIKKSSPMPKLSSPYEKYTPNFARSNTTGRQSFVPGLLPTLHSEGVLFPDFESQHLNERQIDSPQELSSPRFDTQTGPSAVATLKPEVQGDNPDSLSEHSLTGDDSGMDIDTNVSTDSPVKGSLYTHRNISIVPTMSCDDTKADNKATNDLQSQRIDSFQDLSSLNSDDALTPTQHRSHTAASPSAQLGAEEELRTPTLSRPAHDTNDSNGNTSSHSANTADRLPSSLNEKFKNLEAGFQNVARRKSLKPKKRKTSLDDGDKDFKPGKEDAAEDSDYSDGRYRLKKRRKSVEKSATTSSRRSNKGPTPKKSTTRKIIKPAPPTQDHILKSSAYDRPRHSGEGQRSRLDMIDEDAELEISPTKRISLDETPMDLQASSSNEQPTKGLPDPSPTANPDPVLADTPRRDHDHDGNGSSGASQREPFKLTSDNLRRLAQEGQWDWPEDVF
ncbi:Leucine aminopeptidase 1 [Sphaceloma murrayae]|uniref:Leucine aminopeptidase 1 n=1 Tax=Sphaceloma murrayae TaxID=2082308 RepID=A0A2K1R2B5_9PEZI|nr:Leucine aminopeptidase 1 [Sphaceloma murrayae]